MVMSYFSVKKPASSKILSSLLAGSLCLIHIDSWYIIGAKAQHPDMTCVVVTMKYLAAPPSGEELKEIRLTYKLSKRQMGELLGVTASAIAFYEQGNIPVPRKHLMRINRLLSKEPPAQLTGDELRLLRKSRGLTQTQVAEAFGVTSTTISSYELGKISIPDGLAECIVELADPKDYLLHQRKNPTRELLHRIDKSRAEEREQWLRLAEPIEPAELRQLLLSRGLSKDRLSKTLRISKTTLHFYEQGRRKIPKELVYKILELWPDRTVTPSEITELRHTSGLTQSQAAAAIGLTQKSITGYETGKSKIKYNISQKIMEFYREQVEDSDPDKQN